jgi:hypothetical protein
LVLVVCKENGEEVVVDSFSNVDKFELILVFDRENGEFKFEFELLPLLFNEPKLGFAIEFNEKGDFFS